MRRVSGAPALVALALAGALAASAPAHEGAHDPPAAPPGRFEVPAPGSYALPVIERVSDHTLLGVDGPAPLLGLAPGELALVSFVYLSCGGVCPLATALLARLDGEIARAPDLRGRVVLDTVSFDPARDTPERMRELRDRLAPRGRWRFLTAPNAAALRPVLADFGQDAVWIPGEADAPDTLRHVLKVFVVDARGGVRQIYSTGFLDARLVLADLRTLLPSAP